MVRRIYSLIAIFLSCFSVTYLSYIFNYAFFTLQREGTTDGLSPYSISVTNVLWPSLLSSALALIFSWFAYKKQNIFRLPAIVLAFASLLVTLFFQQILAFMLLFQN